jgi:hypothetical protein
MSERLHRRDFRGLWGGWVTIGLLFVVHPVAAGVEIACQAGRPFGMGGGIGGGIEGITGRQVGFSMSEGMVIVQSKSSG